MTELPLILALLILHSGFIAGSMWLARMFARRGDTPQATMPVAPYFVSVTILFGLVTSFHANRLWDRFDDLETGWVRLHLSVDRLEQFASTHPTSTTPALNQAIGTLASLIRAPRARATGEVTSTKASASLQTLRSETLAQGESLPAAQRAHLQHLVAAVESAHSDWSATHIAGRPRVLIWVALLLLALLSNVTIAMVHQDRPRAALRALVIFNLAVGTIFWLMMRYEFRALLVGSSASLSPAS